MINFVNPNNPGDVEIYYESRLYQSANQQLNLLAMESCISQLAPIFDDERIQSMMQNCLTNLGYTGDYSEIPYETQQLAQAGVIAQLIIGNSVTVNATITL